MKEVTGYRFNMEIKIPANGTNKTSNIVYPAHDALCDSMHACIEHVSNNVKAQETIKFYADRFLIIRCSIQNVNDNGTRVSVANDIPIDLSQITNINTLLTSYLRQGEKDIFAVVPPVMSPIFKIFTGDYIDLSRIISITDAMIHNNNCCFKIHYQAMGEPTFYYYGHNLPYGKFTTDELIEQAQKGVDELIKQWEEYRKQRGF